MLEEILNFQGAEDVPDPNDFAAEHILGAAVPVPLPSAINLNKTPSHNQGKTWHCTAYGLTHIQEILNTIEHGQSVKLNPEEQWGNQCVLRGVPSTIDGGDSLQNALKAMVKNGLVNSNNPNIPQAKFEIMGYAFVDKNVVNYKQWLAKGMPIFTGWKEHCFALVGYDDAKSVFIAKNSYGPTWGLNGDGTFTIPYADILKLFSGYIVYDRKDLEMIYKDVSTKSPNAESIRFALDNKLMMGYGSEPLSQDRFFRPDQPMTRAEIAVVLERLYKLLKG